MIKIKKNINSTPQKLNGQTCDRLRQLSLIEKNMHCFSTGIYRDGVMSDLAKLYMNKCGYCETDTTAGAALRVDHYRPKNKIREDENHPGYYWLGYEWTNLVLSCEKCNRYKSNHFPIEGQRVSNPIFNRDGSLNKVSLKSNSKMLLNENPLILNPEIDDINKHLTFLNNGKVVGLSKKGSETVNKCNLNRQELVLKRKKLIDSYYVFLRKMLFHFITTNDEKIFLHSIKIFFTNLKGLQKTSNKYSKLGYLMYTKFDFFFINKFHPKHKDVLHILFEKFKSKNL